MEEMEVIDLREYFDVIQKRKWIIFLITAIAVSTSAVVSFFILDPVYETYTTMMVGKTKSQETMIEYSDVLLSQKLVKTYGEIAKSRTVSKEVIKDLNLSFTPIELKEKIEINSVKDTEIIMIKVQDTDPLLARDIANDLAQVFKKHVTKIMKVDNVQVIDKAEIPKNPVKPRPQLNIAIAGALGIMISLGVVFLLEYLDNTIKTPADVEKYLGLPVMGTIPLLEESENQKVKVQKGVKEYA
ncbi:lipopolysaccharide biosynthesis protein [Crassaminicella profunda]|nr:Wzz/FepE/Etk N-terminal domain-containing protein [Crassaminicella profunda]QZY57595.1 lipopolysaccharide biosynthesis protein [Crassaminicella profunda]